MPDGERIICLSSQYPGPGITPEAGRFEGPLFGLAPDGVFRASSIALGAVGSYPAFSPLPQTHSYCGGLFSVALSVEKPFGLPPASISAGQLLASSARRSYAASRPVEFGLSSPDLCRPGAILHPSKTAVNVGANAWDDKRRLWRGWWRTHAARNPVVAPPGSSPGIEFDTF